MSPATKRPKDFRNHLIVLLALSTAALGGLSLVQQRQLAKRQLPAPTAEPPSTGLSTATPALPPPAPVAETEAPRDESMEEAGIAPETRRGRRNFMEGAMRQLASSPEFQKVNQLRAKARLDERYAALFKKLNLPEASLEQLKNLLADRQNVFRDTRDVLREQGLSGKEGREQFNLKTAVETTACHATC